MACAGILPLASIAIEALPAAVIELERRDRRS